MKPIFLSPIFLTLLFGTVGCTMQSGFATRQISKCDQHNEDGSAAAQIKPFPQVKQEKDADYMRIVIEANLLSLHVCQGSHKMFLAETSSARIEGLADAQGAAECVVQLQSALREISPGHPAYPDIYAELAWWNHKLMQLDPTGYHRLNS